MPAQTVYDPSMHELAIIGGGPAGLSAAYYAAKEGLETTVLEEHKKIGEPVHCGECISEVAVKRMGLELPKEAIAYKAKGIRIYFPSGFSTILQEPGYSLDKHVFEQYLATRAEKAGAKIKMNSRVMGLARKDRAWTINATNCAIKSRALIDASGYQSISNKYVPAINKKNNKYVNGAQYLMEDVPNDGYIEFFIWPQLAPHGYLWIIPKRDGQANVGLVSNDPANSHKNLKKFLSRKGLENKKIIKPFGGLIPETGPLENTYTDGLIMIGDAAGFTSPMFEGGTALGMKSGQMAAQVLGKAYRERDKSKDPDYYNEGILNEYEKMWKKEFPPYSKLLKGKEVFYSYSTEDLNKIGQILPPDLTNMQMTDKVMIGFLMMTVGPDLLLKNIFSALNTFSYSTAEHYGW